MGASFTVVIDNPHLLGTVCGPNDDNIVEISTLLSTPVRTRGNKIVLESDDDGAKFLFRSLLDQLAEIAKSKEAVTSARVRAIFSALESGQNGKIQAFKENIVAIPGSSRRIYPKSQAQAAYIRQMSTHDLVFSVGPAGTGKTYLAIAQALTEIFLKKKRKIILTRPVVETGESLGFLPGDLTQKLAPYLRPLYDAIEDLLESDQLERIRNSNQLEVAPLAYMRGRSLKNCYIVLDEAQNTTMEQMKMFLTRLGEGSRAVVTGDMTQVDLPSGRQSGLYEAVRILGSVDEVAITEFTSSDVVRHPLVKKIVDAYENNN
ncbi:Phosphate starvation-inducible protein PhoH, predicted ATPase [Olavius algarvensis spirochete endosymbiont]|uniref:PhoH family protein n=1 Tax=Olavius algarvensis spirochete endosymbiont TaxID=260710 RepID=UPI00052DF161|nr:PhoH family protein [Olavius algarvensis spirochete endosymbiont]KGM42707.1 phosphate starvation protein PhoH [Alkalispirochaeta odontotermitis]VDB01026.1 Phosphate starvation-inducible protein PhoH, predicted ATPase [Olavius algarvensis spirochete endosymbiont]